jgi:hypothetical protein
MERIWKEAVVEGLRNPAETSVRMAGVLPKF